MMYEGCELITTVAAAAHACWCARLRQQGWRAGQFDPARRLHDALVPFSQLTRCDQDHACMVVLAEGFPDLLAAALWYPRDPRDQS